MSVESAYTDAAVHRNTARRTCSDHTQGVRLSPRIVKRFTESWTYQGPRNISTLRGSV